MKAVIKASIRLLSWLSILGGTILLYAWIGERPRLRIQRYCVPAGKGWGGPPFRILHLSDQHFGKEDWVRRRRLQQIPALLKDVQPDLIVFTGDFLHNDAGLDAVEMLLRLLPPSRLGVFAVLGNHDYVEYSWRQFFAQARQAIEGRTNLAVRAQALLSAVRDAADLFLKILRNERLRFARIPNNTTELRGLLDLYGVRLLHNTAQALPGLPGWWIAGVDDPVEGKPDVTGALAGIPASAHILLLAHNPDLAYSAPAQAAALILSGHTHGGQVTLPWLGAVHTQGTLLSRKRPAGHFDLPGGGQMIVSRGMGESTPLRLRCQPEIVVIDVVSDAVGT